MRSLIFGAALLVCAPPIAAAPLEEQPLQHVTFGSCLRQDRPQPIWEPILAENPDLFIFLGDNVYANTRDPDVMRARYRQLEKQPGFQALWRRVPRIMATWDDHDYGEDDAGADYPMKAEAREIFLDFWKVPPGSGRREHPGVYNAQMWGPAGRRVQVILLDLRTFKTAEQLLGEDQWRWLEEELRRPAELRLIGSSIQVIPEEHRYEKWADYPQERRRLLDLLSGAGRSPALLLSGDRHLGEISCLPPVSDDALCEITSSNMNTSPGGTPKEPNRHRLHEAPFRGLNFGRVDIDWNGSGPGVLLSIRDVKGNVVVKTYKRWRR